MSGQQEQTATLRVVKGEPTAEEIAALVTAVSARRSAPPEESSTRPQSAWAAYWRTVRQPVRPGPGAWRASAWPR